MNNLFPSGLEPLTLKLEFSDFNVVTEDGVIRFKAFLVIKRTLLRCTGSHCKEIENYWTAGISLFVLQSNIITFQLFEFPHDGSVCSADKSMFVQANMRNRARPERRSRALC